MAVSNLTSRVIVAVLAIPGMLAVCYLGYHYFYALVTVVGLAGYYEFVLLARKKNAYPYLFFGLAAVAALITNAEYHFSEWLPLLGGITFALVFSEMFRGKENPVFNIGTGLFGIFYAGLFLGSLLEIREFFTDHTHGAYLVLSLFVTIWLSDSAAYFGGRALGKHLLAPKISPKKTWEGAIFGFVFAVGTMLLAKIIILDFFQWHDVLFFGVVAGIIGPIGDLTESVLKRDAGIKDSSALLFGHGGFLDRFDSLIATAPVIFFYLHYFIPNNL